MTLLAGRRGTVAVAALLAIGIAASYAGSFGVGFYFDDTYGIANNPAIRSLRNIPSFFTDPFAIWTDHSQVDMRPVLLISYALNYAISGVRPWSYHAVNLLLHLTASLLVFVIVRDHLLKPQAASSKPQALGPWSLELEPSIFAAAAALFFALAPLNSQPVVYVWARSALLCVTLYLGAFLAFVRRRWVLGGLLFSLALLTKAIAVSLPVLVLLHDFLYRDRARYPTLLAYVRDWRRLVLPALVPGTLAVAYVLYRSAVLPGWTAEARQAAGVTPGVWFMSQWSALLYYVRLFVWPDGLSADHDFPYTRSLTQPRAWLALIVLLSWLAAALRMAKQAPQVTFATLWFFITLAPESSFAPLAEVINDHRPYIASSLGLSVLLAWLLERGAALVAPGARRSAFIAACLTLCIAAVPMNVYRTWQWGDSLRIWQDTVRKSPNNGRAWMNAGQILMGRGQLREAREYLEQARTRAPDYAWIYMNLSVLEAHEGHLQAALDAANQAVRLRPDHDRSHFYLGSAFEKLGRSSDAAAAYQHAIDINPRDTEAQAALARVNGKAGPDEVLMRDGLYALQTLKDPEVAAGSFRKVLVHTPTHYGATYQLAVALDAAAQPAEARPLWEQVLTMAQGYNDGATAATARARLAQPDVVSDEVRMRVGLEALNKRHDPEEAAEQFREVLQHTPTHYGATFQLAKALDAAGKPDESHQWWEKILAMATAVPDPETRAVAQRRLGQKP